HGRGIVHRDVKPANIMTDEDGAVKITDFGIAKIAAMGSVTETRTVVGTPNYMSPEQVQGLPIDGRSDQFSLAVIAYEILSAGRPQAAQPRDAGAACGSGVIRIHGVGCRRRQALVDSRAASDEYRGRNWGRGRDYMAGGIAFVWIRFPAARG